MEKQWILYGAYGYTGKLLTKEAINRGLKPVLAGRDEEKVKNLAQKYGLDYLVFDLEDEKGVEKEISDYQLVLNAAGPFKFTSRPFVHACLEKSVNYLDITGEISVFEYNFTKNQQAKDSEIALISGVGFDVVPSDCLANYVAKKIQNPIKLDLGIAALSQFSPGTLKTMIENLPSGAAVRREGKIEEYPFGKGEKIIQFLDKERKTYPIAWGDIATAYHSTGIPNITTYMPLPNQLTKTMKSFGFLIRNLFKLKFVRNIAKNRVEKKVKGPNKEVRESAISHLYGRVENQKGEVAEAWLKTIEAYKLTAITGINAVEKLFQNKLMGALTPAQAFGEDFILEIPNTERLDQIE